MVEQKRTYSSTSIINNSPPHIDGKLDEEIWSRGYWATDFVQHQPNENTPPSAPTAFKILHDHKYLYVGIRCHDSHPQLISSRMSRRDGNEGDWIEIILDSNDDLRSAYSLTLSAGGVKGDKILSFNGVAEDAFWNPIWSAQSHLDEEGWTVEMRIPFSQLRFGQAQNRTWGLQVRRNHFRQQETSVWQRIPLDASGWISEFGKLEGLDNIKPQKLIEIQPYITSSLKTTGVEPQDDNYAPVTTNVDVGLDGKIGVSNDMTIDFTFNPDFGQIEADPSAIALDGFQLFFAEQRPFFIENKEILNYQFSTPIIGSIYNNDNLFYSRRIGGQPHGSVALQSQETIVAPNKTTIIGAAKFGGKNQNGLSIGILETVTANEYALVSKGAASKRVLIEPLTNYFVGRIQKDFNHKNTFIGGILTSTIRNLDDQLASMLHRSATTAGLDLYHQWDNRNYYIGANLVMSHVQGNAAAIAKTQMSIPHLFQKTDADHVTLDPTRTSLTGTGGDIKIGKAGNGHLTFESGLTWRSPQLELNDLGFMREADVIFNYAGINYNFIKPFSIFRSARFGYKHWLFADFGGKLNYVDWDVDFHGIFSNNAHAILGFFSQPHIYSRSFLQGGPRFRLPGQYGLWWGLGTDPRKRFSVRYNAWTKTGNSDSFYLLQNGLTINYQPTDRFSLALSPRYTVINHRLQYITTAKYQEEDRFITARLDQKTLSIALRLNYTITPDLTIQYYGQPFISTGKYDHFNYVTNPLSRRQSDQLTFFDVQQISKDLISAKFVVDHDTDGRPDYNFRNPDFAFVQFQSNMVLRYEYKSGSEIYLVWSQGFSNIGVPSERFTDDIRNQLFGQETSNNFLLKVTYRFY